MTSHFGIEEEEDPMIPVLPSLALLEHLEVSDFLGRHEGTLLLLTGLRTLSMWANGRDLRPSETARLTRLERLRLRAICGIEWHLALLSSSTLTRLEVGVCKVPDGLLHQASVQLHCDLPRLRTLVVWLTDAPAVGGLSVDRSLPALEEVHISCNLLLQSFFSHLFGDASMPSLKRVRLFVENKPDPRDKELREAFARAEHRLANNLPRPLDSIRRVSCPHFARERTPTLHRWIEETQ